MRVAPLLPLFLCVVRNAPRLRKLEGWCSERVYTRKGMVLLNSAYVALVEGHSILPAEVLHLRDRLCSAPMCAQRWAHKDEEFIRRVRILDVVSNITWFSELGRLVQYLVEWPIYWVCTVEESSRVLIRW